MTDKKRVLITGATGLLGTSLLLTQPENVEVYAAYHDYKQVLDLPGVNYIHLEIRDQDDVKRVVQEVKPQVIMHTAAHGRLDYCEANQDDAYKTNFLGTKYLVEAAKQIGARIIFCSTNATFDGYNPLYNEESPQEPANYYGKTKVMAEKMIRESGVDYTIVRLMTMYGWNFQPQRKNMVSMLIEKLGQGNSLFMTNDLWNNMLYSKEAAKFFWKIVTDLDKTAKQTFNIAGDKRANRFETTMDACGVFGLDKSKVTEVDSDYFKGSEVPRAPDTCFDTSKAQRVMGFKPITLKVGFEDMKQNPLPNKIITL
ncbi:hypothetical protein A2631_02845 [Candidatus Daviesbacteria bacterium RIFCSPHIGHO2_01_FULL_44_29]|uniref:RmlD-like substrate binding domain-containing protein n=1 Tax=Candidatus Daviesbacteria bacterium RIFCSPHIGHO2_02_FULL_43_12 TaxID=1797776 RepID=A0A1F5KKA6_9BACT|nr:MAG: hypothetical protein A2631_02845 [Candidatus Daviesbacteria bacterium RIFCSPHIGHO2_01_FULL_44_29]OGE40825.1 MAG: hypothetical protein A3E86_02505 [Candidatus Daviesbacteria bacterium RIFCSPHIGHO2_12_FULL_47_45]OGE41322.1 MAG: hypothetical protein A3D25_02240 [Candidatus Daviesbacteria bacterium RIFCSPHIGHO2_02_FULL_43_12]OGE69523.1 MAG: hypothetical protein A3B55_03980 [Candidatus Daviesbacteria bacterium RIFCSPLOWO2_01_FULL_43_15]